MSRRQISLLLIEEMGKEGHQKLPPDEIKTIRSAKQNQRIWAWGLFITVLPKTRVVIDLRFSRLYGGSTGDNRPINY